MSIAVERTGRSTSVNELGMRPMQERVYQMRGEQFLLIKSPPASGKSRALMYIALDKLANQGVKQAVIVVLDQLRKLSEEDLALLRPLDRFGLLVESKSRDERADALSDEELLSALATDDVNDIGRLVHVRSAEAKREAPDYVADRIKSEDFDLYKTLFDAVQADPAVGRRTSKRFIRDASIEEKDFFILSGQMVYVAAVGEPLKASNGESDARLRVIYSNGTESNILRCSL